MRVSKRIITFFLALAMLFSLFVFASASSSTGGLVDTASVSNWNSYLSSAGSSTTDFWAVVNSAFSDAGLGAMASYDKLSNVSSVWYKRANSLLNKLTYSVDVPKPSVVYDSSLGVYRMYDAASGNYLVNASGHFPYYKEASGSSSPTLTYIWKYRSDVKTGTPYNIIPYADLKSIVDCLSTESQLRCHFCNRYLGSAKCFEL